MPERPRQPDGPQLGVWPPTWGERNFGRLTAAYFALAAAAMIYVILRG